MENADRKRAAGTVLNAFIALMIVGGPGAPSARAGADGSTDAPGPKCGLAFRLEQLGLAEKGRLPEDLPFAPTPAAFQTSRVIGRFEFFYDTSGPGAPAMLSESMTPIPGSFEEFVDSAGAVFNAVYHNITGALGYGDPIRPPRTLYEVWIFDNRYYGETVPEERIGTTTPSRWTSHINIDNDFLNFYSAGMAGLRVTAAHEFFHAVQLAVYGFWSSDVYFLEMTSTWMEEVLYGDANDYYQYLRGPAGPAGYEPRGHFAAPAVSLTQADGLIEYSRAIFPIFLEKRYGREVIRQAWELVPSGTALTALDEVLVRSGASFREAFLAWNFWNSTTGPDADTLACYPEGREYPRIRARAVAEYLPPSRIIPDSIFTLGSSYHPVIVNGNSMLVIVSNIRMGGPPQRVSYEYEIAENGDGTYKRLANGIFVKLRVPDPDNWSTHESAPEIIPGVTPAPNPYLASQAGVLTFRIPLTEKPRSIRLKLLNSAMDDVFDGALAHRGDLSTPFIQLAEWNGLDRWGRPVSSGVYYYILMVDGMEHTGKIAVVR